MKKFICSFLILFSVIFLMTSCSAMKYPYVDVSYNEGATSGAGTLRLSAAEYSTFEDVFVQAEVMATIQIVQYEKTYTVIDSKDQAEFSALGNTLFLASVEELHKGSNLSDGDSFYLYQLGTWKGGTALGYPLFQKGVRLLIGMNSFQMDMYRSKNNSESGYKGVLEAFTLLEVVSYEGVDYVIDRAHPEYLSSASLTPVEEEIQQAVLESVGSDGLDRDVYLYQDLLHYMEELKNEKNN